VSGDLVAVWYPGLSREEAVAAFGRDYAAACAASQRVLERQQRGGYSRPGRADGA